MPTLHGDTFSIPEGAVKLADAFMLRRDGTYRRINMAFRYGRSYAFQFEPQLTLEEFRVWDRELRGDYQFLGADSILKKKRWPTSASLPHSLPTTKDRCGGCY